MSGLTSKPVVIGGLALAGVAGYYYYKQQEEVFALVIMIYP